MTYREKESVVNIFSGLLIAAGYSWYVYNKHLQQQFNLSKDYQAWGKIFLIFIIVSVVVRIIIYIVFHIINTIATRDDKIPVSDERDKLIELKSTRNAHHAFSGSFVIAFVLLALGLPVYWVFIVFLISGLISEIVENVSKIYYHRKGI